MSFPFHVFASSVPKAGEKQKKILSKKPATTFNYGNENNEIINKILDERQSGEIFQCDRRCLSVIKQNCDKFKRLNMHMIIIVCNLMFRCMEKYGNDNVETLFNELKSGNYTSYNSFLRNDTSSIADNILDYRIKIEFEVYREILLPMLV
jgi:hypothetical protein